MLETSVAPSVSIAPARRLTGLSLDMHWKISERIGNDEKNEHTPGFFSVGYFATRNLSDDGIVLQVPERAFLKAFDISAVIQLSDGKTDPTSMMKALGELVNAFNSENALLDFCRISKLDRIVKAVGRGFVMPPIQPGELPLAVPYLLFELADGDIRKFVGKAALADDKWRLAHLHQVAVGLQQLHSNKIAHQDLKPANVLVFEDVGAKIADLGRASRADSPSPHDGEAIPGDRRYAPPELIYGERPTAWADRRESTDIYHLGSLLCFVFTGVQINTGLFHYLPPELHPRVWRGRYEEILPHLQAAFTKVLADARDLFPEWARDDLTLLLSHMCTPNYKQRGDPDARSQVESPIGLDRFISKLDKLSKHASIRIGKPG
jgi:serine/threonine protein kinase